MIMQQRIFTQWVLSCLALLLVPFAVACGDDCQTAGLADSYVFAASWQPAFCKTHQSKPECQVLSPQAWAASNFTLHGLWPDLAQCGNNYGPCATSSEQSDSCPSLSPEVEQALEQVMPSAAAGSCLQRHEWDKHGTCQRLDKDAYFTVAITLTHQLNDSGLGAFMAKHVGERVSTQAFLDELDTDLGAGTRQRTRLNCTAGNLTEIDIALPATIPTTPDLRALIQQASPHFGSNCSASFRIAAVSQ